MSIKHVSLFSLVLVSSLFFAATALAWTGPTATPPGSNIAAPINVGSVSQVKTGGIWASSIGSDTGYCIGTSCISSWPVSGGSTTWVTNGTSIYYSAGSVGVGILSPGYPFDVRGGTTGVIANIGTASNCCAANATLGLSEQTNSNGRMAMIQFHDAGAQEAFIRLQKANRMFEIGDNQGAGAGLAIMNAAGTARVIILSPTGTIDNRGSVMYSNRYYDDDPNYYIDSNVDSQMNVVYANQFLYRSDERLKKDIQPLHGTLDQVLSLQPVSFLWKDPTLATSTQIGFIAQQVEKVVPQLVSTNPSTGMEAVDYARVTPLLVGSVQALNQKIDAQQQEIDQLKADIAALKKR